jgi:hypothetical protein
MSNRENDTKQNPQTPQPTNPNPNQDDTGNGQEQK